MPELEDITLDQLIKFMEHAIKFIETVQGMINERDEHGDTEVLDAISMNLYNYVFNVSDIFGIDPLEGKI